MLSNSLNNRIGNTMAIIAVSQMLMDRIDSLIKINKFDVSSIGINSSLDLTINLAKMVGMSYDEIVDLLTDFLTRNYGSTIKTMDKTIRIAMLGALDAMVSCANSPIIGDDMLCYTSAGTFYNAEKPISINLHSLDIYNLFSKSTPTGDLAEYFYGDVPSGATPSMVWKSGDMNAFIWYAMNMVEPLSEDDDKYIEKLTWDNRNRYFKDFLFNEDLSQYENGEMVTYSGTVANSFWSGVDGEGEMNPSRKKILKIDYIDRTNSLSIQFPKDTYGKKTIFGFTLGKEGDEEKKRNKFSYVRNRTIYDFNKDYVDNLRIFYVKPLVASIINSALSNTINLSINGRISLEEEIIRGEVSKIITKIIEADDTEIDDCYFTFSNEEYDALVREAELRKKGVIVKTGDTNIGVSADPGKFMETINQMTGTATLQEQKTIIKNAFTAIASVTGATDDVIDTKLNWDGDSFGTSILQLLKNILMKFIEAFLTPKVVLIFLINFKFANGELPKTPLDFLSAFMKMLWPVIKSLVDFFINFLFEEVLKRVKELMEVYILKLSLEQLEKYKEIVLALIENCTLNLYIPYGKKTQLIGNIDNVFGADIVETKEEPEKDNC